MQVVVFALYLTASGGIDIVESVSSVGARHCEFDALKRARQIVPYSFMQHHKDAAAFVVCERRYLINDATGEVRDHWRDLNVCHERRDSVKPENMPPEGWRCVRERWTSALPLFPEGKP